MPVTYNVDPVAPWKIQEMVVDWWATRELDLLSTSHYAGSNEATASSGVNLTILKEFAGDKETWITEFQGGPCPTSGALGELFQPSWTGRDIELEVNSAVSHGIRGLIFYRWEPLVSGPETCMQAMIEADEYDTERRLATKHTIDRLREHSAIVGPGRNRGARVALYLRRRQIHEAEERRVEPDGWRGPLYHGIRGQYALWTDLGMRLG